MARLPQPGQDDGVWGDILNTYLLTTHNSDGSLKDDIITEAQLAPAVQTKLNEPPTVADNTITEDKLAPALETKINQKADTADLAAVATSGDYTDLANVPVIGANVIVLGPADPVPGGTPAGTVIIRTVS